MQIQLTNDQLVEREQSTWPRGNRVRQQLPNGKVKNPFPLRSEILRHYGRKERLDVVR